MGGREQSLVCGALIRLGLLCLDLLLLAGVLLLRRGGRVAAVMGPHTFSCANGRNFMFVMLALVLVLALSSSSLIFDFVLLGASGWLGSWRGSARVISVDF